MATDRYYTLLTDYGADRIAAAATGTPLNLSFVAVGDANGIAYDPVREQVALVHEVWRGGISQVGTQAGGKIVIEVQIPANVGPFAIYELGILDSTGGLVAVTKYTGEPKIAAADGIVNTVSIWQTILVGNADAVTITIDPATRITIANLETLFWCSVVSATTAAPPVSPFDGALYYVPTAPAPTGAWTGKAGQMAQYVLGLWVFKKPPNGFIFRAADTKFNYSYYGNTATGWYAAEDQQGPVLFASAAEHIGGSPVNNKAATPALTDAQLHNRMILFRPSPYFQDFVPNPPVSPSLMQVWIVSAGATGAFAGQQNKFATWITDATGAYWAFTDAPNGHIATAAIDGTAWRFSSGVWRRFSETLSDTNIGNDLASSANPLNDVFTRAVHVGSSGVGAGMYINAAGISGGWNANALTATLDFGGLGPHDLKLYSNGVPRWVVETVGHGRPAVDNTYNWGAPDKRIANIFVASGVINPSDGTMKRVRGPLDEAERRVAARLPDLVRIYQWHAAIEAKGEAARLHVGVIAQEIIAAFEAEDLDWRRYGIIGEDAMTAPVERVVTRDEPVMDDVPVDTVEVAIEDGRAVRRTVTRVERRPRTTREPLWEADGSRAVHWQPRPPASPDEPGPHLVAVELWHDVPVTVPVDHTITVDEPTGETRLSVRYDELAMFCLGGLAALPMAGPEGVA